MANATVPYRSTSRPIARPSVDDLERYLTDHTVPQAAKRWHVNERTIRKWRARTATEQPQEARKPITAIDTPSFVPTSDDIAGDHSMWRDPWTGELMPVPPGAHRKDWERERIAARDRHKAAVAAALTPAPDPALLGSSTDTMSSQCETVSAAPAIKGSPPSAPASREGTDVETSAKAVQSLETNGPGRTMQDDQAIMLPPAPIVRERVVERIVYRVPVDRRDSPVIVWAREHMPLTQLLLACLITAVLIYVASFG